VFKKFIFLCAQDTKDNVDSASQADIVGYTKGQKKYQTEKPCSYYLLCSYSPLLPYISTHRTDHSSVNGREVREYIIKIIDTTTQRSDSHYIPLFCPIYHNQTTFKHITGKRNLSQNESNHSNCEWRSSSSGAYSSPSSTVLYCLRCT